MSANIESWKGRLEAHHFEPSAVKYGRQHFMQQEIDELRARVAEQDRVIAEMEAANTVQRRAVERLDRYDHEQYESPSKMDGGRYVLFSEVAAILAHKEQQA